MSVNYISDGTRGALSAGAHASRYLSGPGRLSRPDSIQQKGRAKPLDAPVRTFGFSRAPRPRHPALARNASESARSLPQAAGDHAGELCLSPVGLALVTRIAPVSMAAMLMGVWFLSSFAANLLPGYLAGMLEAVERGAVFHFLGGQADFFLILVVISLAAGVLLLAIAGRLCRLMHGRG